MAKSKTAMSVMHLFTTSSATSGRVYKGLTDDKGTRSAKNTLKDKYWLTSDLCAFAWVIMGSGLQWREVRLRNLTKQAGRVEAFKK